MIDRQQIIGISIILLLLIGIVTAYSGGYLPDPIPDDDNNETEPCQYCMSVEDSYTVDTEAEIEHIEYEDGQWYGHNGFDSFSTTLQLMEFDMSGYIDDKNMVADFGGMLWYGKNSRSKEITTLGGIEKKGDRYYYPETNYDVTLQSRENDFFVSPHGNQYQDRSGLDIFYNGSSWFYTSGKSVIKYDNNLDQISKHELNLTTTTGSELNTTIPDEDRIIYGLAQSEQNYWIVLSGSKSASQGDDYAFLHVYDENWEKVGDTGFFLRNPESLEVKDGSAYIVGDPENEQGRPQNDETVIWKIGLTGEKFQQSMLQSILS